MQVEFCQYQNNNANNWENFPTAKKSVTPEKKADKKAIVKLFLSLLF